MTTPDPPTVMLVPTVDVDSLSPGYIGVTDWPAYFVIDVGAKLPMSSDGTVYPMTQTGQWIEDVIGTVQRQLNVHGGYMWQFMRLIDRFPQGAFDTASGAAGALIDHYLMGKEFDS